MIQKKIQIQNSLADFQDLTKSHLSIQVTLDGFTYCIFDKDLVDVVQLEEFEFDHRAQTPEQLLEFVHKIYEEEPILSKHYGSVNVTHKNNLSTIVPESLFEKEKEKEYLKYTVKVLETDAIAVDTLAENETNNVYIPFDNINKFLEEKYGKFDFLHSSSILVSSLLKYYKDEPGKLFFVNVAKNSFEIVFIEDNKLQFHNTFLYYTKEDFLYYILFTMEQLFLDTETQKLTFLGAIDKKSPLFDITYTYVRYIDFLKVNNFSLSEEFYEMNPHVEKHYFFELLNQF
jgi:hypothetical protein